MYPRHRPTKEWNICDTPGGTYRIQLSQNNSEGISQFVNRKKIVGLSHEIDDRSVSSTSLLQVTCDGRMDLVGRRHFVGIIPRAVQTLSALPTGILKQAMNMQVRLLNYFWSAYVPLGKYYANFAKFIESDKILADNDIGK